jgi:hypothetical protein
MKRFFLLKPSRLLFEPPEIDFRDTVQQTRDSSAKLPKALNAFTRPLVIVGAIGLVLLAVYVAFYIWTYFHR